MTAGTDFVLASYLVQWAGCVLMASVLRGLHRIYGHLYLAHVALCWLCLSFFFLGGGAALMLARHGVVPWHPLRLGASMVELVAAYWAVGWLFVGAWEIASRRNAPRRTIVLMLVVLGLLGLVLPLPYAFDAAAAQERFFVRFGIRSLVTGLAFVAGGIALWRARIERFLGRRLVVVAFVLYGVQQLHSFVIGVLRLFFSVSVPYSGFLAFLDFFLLVMIGLGTIVWLLEAERDAVVRVAERVDYLSNYDPVTGLANRRLLENRLALAVVRARQQGSEGALLAIDVDGFTRLNDLVGRGEADQVLRLLGQRLVRCVGPKDTVARIGNDEFAVLASLTPGTDDVEALVHRVQEAVRQPAAHRGQELYLTASVGVALLPRHGDAAESLLHRAEAALHEAQRHGRDDFRVYSRDLVSLAADRFGLEGDLHRALEAEAFVLHFQPIVSLPDGHVAAFEALVRWPHPRRGLLPPSEFLGVASAMGILHRLEAWVLQEACRCLRLWHDKGGDDLGMAVNLSAGAFLRTDIVDRVEAALEAHRLPADRLQLELTESAAVQQTEITTRALDRLRQLGVRIAIDDFGTGYSSLSQLRDLPADVLKMDRSFVRRLGQDAQEDSMAAAIVSLAHGLGLPVVAEGIERERQRDVLASLGCDLGQGFLFGRPLPAAEYHEVVSVRAGRDPDRVARPADGEETA